MQNQASGQPAPTPTQQASASASAHAATGASKTAQAQETLAVLHQMSVLLGTGLDKETLALCVSLCEQGVNPEALAAVIKELRREYPVQRVID
ncbi:mitotic-spindle organizing gamma-tubulin ring associated-domain-containing protein [Chytriomyces sp. MP71]|nr:mitotic-spindle organizing gamma-tubulin ring associated-domain-containing protein [Chytriomyces sp. MP71]